MRTSKERNALNAFVSVIVLEKRVYIAKTNYYIYVRNERIPIEVDYFRLYIFHVSYGQRITVDLEQRGQVGKLAGLNIRDLVEVKFKKLQTRHLTKRLHLHRAYLVLRQI